MSAAQCQMSNRIIPIMLKIILMVMMVIVTMASIGCVFPGFLFKRV